MKKERHSMFGRVNLLGLLFFVFGCGCSLAGPASKDIDKRIQSFETGLRPTISIAGEPEQRWTVQERMADWKVPGLSVAVIRDGKIAWAKAYGVKEAGGQDKVDADTVFSVGSVSKVPAAAITLRLADANLVDLNRNVNDYLTRWKVPENEFTAEKPVTLRGIMSHTAGLSGHGFPDFQPGETLPTVIDTLEGREPAKTKPVRVQYAPGARMQYSGGGVTVEQLAIEEITGLPFTEAAKKYVFNPLGMTRSTYENPLPAVYGDIAKAHDENGALTALPRGWESMPEMAASGLWTTSTDLAKLVIALIDSYNGADDAFLSQDLARSAMQEVGPSQFGLGPQLSGEGRIRRFFHAGSNNSYKAWIEGYPLAGEGVVILTNGANGDGLINEVRNAVADAEGWGDLMTVEAPQITLSLKHLDALSGSYRGGPASSILTSRIRDRFTEYGMKVIREENDLHLDIANGAVKFQLIPLDDMHFILKNGLEPRYHMTVEFVWGYDGTVESLIFKSGNYADEARKVVQE